MRETYYRSANLHVYGVRPFASDRVVVAFGNYSLFPGLDQPGFGEAFLQKYGIDAIHIVPASNAWYQYPDMPAALAAAAAQAAAYAWRITYGSSMGGYAAINFAEDIDAHRIVAISPQFSIDPKKMPEDPRWRHEAERIRFPHDRIGEGTGRRDRQCYLVYDDRHALDRTHARRITEALPVTEIALPFAGHPAGAALVETGLMSKMARDLFKGSIDPPAFVAEFVARISTTAAYLFNQAEALPDERLAEKLRLARRASELQPHAAAFRHLLADLLSRFGAHQEAIAIMRDLVAGHGDLPELCFALAVVYERAKLLPEAVATARAGLAGAADSATLWLLLGRLLAESGNNFEAEQALRRAIALAPDGAEARYRLSQVLARQGRRGEALLAAAAAAERAPDKAGYHAHEGRRRMSVADWADAAPAFARALELEPNRIGLRLWLHLARLLRRTDWRRSRPRAT